MNLKFCPNCGTPLERHDRGDKTIWICPVCNHEVEDKPISYKEVKGLRLSSKTKAVGEGVVIEKEELGALSSITSCPKCGHSPVYYTSIQSRAADEPPVRIYKCPKCGQGWREYS